MHCLINKSWDISELLITEKREKLTLLQYQYGKYIQILLNETTL